MGVFVNLRAALGRALTFLEMDANFNNLKNGVDNSAPINSPVLTGIPAAPTAAPGTNTTQLATTAFVKALGDTKISVGGDAGTVDSFHASQTGAASSVVVTDATGTLALSGGMTRSHGTQKILKYGSLVTSVVVPAGNVTANAVAGTYNLPSGGAGLLALISYASDNAIMGIKIYSFCAAFDGGSNASSILLLASHGFDSNDYYQNAYLAFNNVSTLQTDLQIKNSVSLNMAQAVTYKVIHLAAF